MAPTRPALKKNTATANFVRNSITTRSKNSLMIMKEVRGKRKADGSPAKETAVKRSAFCDVTNSIIKKAQVAIDNKNGNKVAIKENVAVARKVVAKTKMLPSVKTIVRTRPNENLPPPVVANKIQTRASTRLVTVPYQTALKPKESAKEPVATNNAKVKTRLSNEFEKSEESLYSTALEEMNSSAPSLTASTNRSKTRLKSTSSSETLSEDSGKPVSVTLVAEEMEIKLSLESPEVPDDVVNFDKENWNDIFQVSHYAMDIFNYMKGREPQFAIPDYMDRQVCLTKWMRSLLVDWMVEIQESFELNHETLYLGVKLVDRYLSKMAVSKEMLQLVGAAAMFIASKYDERIPPHIKDFLYICDGAYSKKELIRMEINVLKMCNYDLGMPISYRFLRRYARCAKLNMPTLTLARFILEYSLMDYATVTIPDSKLAAASLYLALQMKNVSGWTPTLEFYTGYKRNQFLSIVHLLNNGLHRKPKEQLMTVRNKYTHKIFFEVAKTPLITNEQLKP